MYIRSGNVEKLGSIYTVESGVTVRNEKLDIHVLAWKDDQMFFSVCKKDKFQSNVYSVH